MLVKSESTNDTQLFADASEQTFVVLLIFPIGSQPFPFLCRISISTSWIDLEQNYSIFLTDEYPTSL